eukprot:jgi/Chrzof1/1179/Cz01g43190.t1
MVLNSLHSVQAKDALQQELLNAQEQLSSAKAAQQQLEQLYVDMKMKLHAVESRQQQVQEHVQAGHLQVHAAYMLHPDHKATGQQQPPARQSDSQGITKQPRSQPACDYSSDADDALSSMVQQRKTKQLGRLQPSQQVVAIEQQGPQSLELLSKNDKIRAQHWKQSPTTQRPAATGPIHPMMYEMGSSCMPLQTTAAAKAANAEQSLAQELKAMQQLLKAAHAGNAEMKRQIADQANELIRLRFEKIAKEASMKQELKQRLAQLEQLEQLQAKQDTPSSQHTNSSIDATPGHADQQQHDGSTVPDSVHAVVGIAEPERIPLADEVQGASKDSAVHEVSHRPGSPWCRRDSADELLIRQRTDTAY